MPTPTWRYDKTELKKTPSYADGIDNEAEQQMRREGSRFILDVGSQLDLRYDTTATACVYFHRFFMYHSFKEYNRYLTALGCLFLAGKVEETPKKCKDLIQSAKERLSEKQFEGLGEDPKKFEEEIMAIERVLLQTIRFDLHVDHPYEILLKYAKVIKGDKEKVQKLVQMAWTFINDSFCTMLSLQWEPEIIAISLMYLAGRMSKFDIVDWHNRKNVPNEHWWDQLVEDLSVELMEEICHQVLDLYSKRGKDEKKESGKLSFPSIDAGVPPAVPALSPVKTTSPQKSAATAGSKIPPPLVATQTSIPPPAWPPQAQFYATQQPPPLPGGTTAPAAGYPPPGAFSSSYQQYGYGSYQYYYQQQPPLPPPN